MLSNTGEYALRAVLYLAEREGSGPVRVDDIAADLAVPRNYLSKILHALVKRGILHSLRGPKGGFELALPSSLVTLYDAVEPFEDIERRMCLLGRSECSDEAPCAVHGRWKGVATEVALFFRETTLSDVVAGGARSKVGAILG
jgi:Rrf2 family transcriptional regulator, iron-sulfur cluster assembly transcription factor